MVVTVVLVVVVVVVVVDQHPSTYIQDQLRIPIVQRHYWFLVSVGVIELRPYPYQPTHLPDT